MSGKLAAMLTLMLPLYSYAEADGINTNIVLKISILSTNTVLLNGDEVEPNELKNELAKAKKNNGVVWYYRESAEKEPPPAALRVINMVIDNKLPISMSTKSDFSDYVDEKGNSVPRRSR